MANFICQLGWATLPIYAVKHYFDWFFFAQVVSEGD